MLQAVQIETQAKQQGLAHLHRQAAAWSASRELALDRGEDTLDQRAVAIESLRKRMSTEPAYLINGRLDERTISSGPACGRQAKARIF